jgi:hypothetical protein
MAASRASSKVIHGQQYILQFCTLPDPPTRAAEGREGLVGVETPGACFAHAQPLHIPHPTRLPLVPWHPTQW